jgi:hypothetical protein
MRIKPTTKNSLVVKIHVYLDCPVQCPDIVIRSIQIVTRSLRVTITHPKFLWEWSLRTLYPEYPDIYPEYPGTLHPTASFL